MVVKRGLTRHSDGPHGHSPKRHRSALAPPFTHETDRPMFTSYGERNTLQAAAAAYNQRARMDCGRSSAEQARCG